MIPEEALERDFQQAVEFELRRMGVPFVSQADSGEGNRIDLLVGEWGIELKVDSSVTLPKFLAGKQAVGYLRAFPLVMGVVVAIAHPPSRQVYTHLTTREGGAPLVLSRQGIGRSGGTLPLARRAPLPVPVESEIAVDPLTQGDYEAIKQVLASWPWAYPHLVFCKLLRGTGLRIAEALRLTRGHVQRDGPRVLLLVLRGKKRGVAKWERMPISPELGADLLAFIAGRGVVPGQPIFPFKALAFERAFARAGEEALGRRVTPHQLRHLYIKFLIDNGLPVATTAKMVGHEDSRTTEKAYYDLTLDQRHAINLRVPV